MASHEIGTNNGNTKLAAGLGWFSIGLGLAEMAAPGKMARLIGLQDKSRTRTLLRTYGVREMAAGLGILAASRPTGWVWARVAGDVVDTATLTSALGSSSSQKTRIAVAIAAVLGVTALDVLCGKQLSAASDGRPGSKRKTTRVPIVQTILINRSPEDVYRTFRDFENFPNFMSHVESVQVQGDRRSHWIAKAPAGRSVEWDAEITDDQPNRLIAWRSLENADVYNSGQVRFDPGPGGRGTMLRVELQYAPPGGTAGAWIAKLFGEEPSQQLYDDLRRFKQIIETGEVLKSDASIHSGMHAAQPPAPEEEPELQPSRA